jgi:hypothetical protein
MPVLSSRAEQRAEKGSLAATGALELPASGGLMGWDELFPTRDTVTPFFVRRF